jgi:hypothetical protein
MTKPWPLKIGTLPFSPRKPVVSLFLTQKAEISNIKLNTSNIKLLRLCSSVFICVHLWLLPVWAATGDAAEVRSPIPSPPRHQDTKNQERENRDATVFAAKTGGVPIFTPRVLQSTAEGVTLAFEFGEPTLSEAAPGLGAEVVELGGCIRDQEPGFPDLPQLRIICGIAQHGDIQVSVRAADFHELNECEIAPVPDWRGRTNHQDTKTPEKIGTLPASGGVPIFIEEPWYRTAACYGQDRFYPPELVKTEGINWVRSVRVARLLLSPIQYNPVQRRLRTYYRFVVDIRFTLPAEVNDGREEGKPDPFESVYPHVLVNGDVARHWKAFADGKDKGEGKIGTLPFSPRKPVVSQFSFFDRSAVWVKVVIESSGVYRIGYDDLARAGFNPGLIDPRTFQLYTVGQRDEESAYADTMNQVSLHVTGDADSSFGRQDYIIFYGQAVRSLYTRYNVYWLTWGAGAGRRMIEGSGAPGPEGPVRTTGLARDHLEEDWECPARSGLLWVWKAMNKANTESCLSANFPLHLSTPQEMKRLIGLLYSTTDANRMNVYLNHVLLDSFSFGAYAYGDPFRFEFNYDSLPCPGLDSLGNTLTLELVGAGSQEVYPDYFEAAYVKRLKIGTLPASGGVPIFTEFFVVESTPQTFAVTGLEGEPLVLALDNPLAPGLISDWRHRGDSVVFRVLVNDTSRYLVTDLDRLRRPIRVERRSPGKLKIGTLPASGGVPIFAIFDYVVVAPDYLYDAARALERYRTDNVPGLPGARAKTVRLSEIYDDFAFGREDPIAIKEFFRSSRPAYGLLLGDATYDYRGILGVKPWPGVPPHEVGYDVDPSGYLANARATDSWYADWDGSGMTPDMMLGRVTVRAPQECQQFIARLRRYEQGTPGFWCRRGILLGDDEWLGNTGSVDPIGLRHIGACETIAALWSGILELAKVYLTEYPYVCFGDKPGAREELHRQIRRGALLFCYFGHGAGEAITRENVLSVQMVPTLDNQGRSPFYFFGSCAVGRWEDTRSECLAEELVRIPHAPGIASIAASKATNPGTNLMIAQTLYTLLLADPDSSIGRAFLSATTNQEIYHLFGDPAMRLPLPRTDGIVRMARDTLQPGKTGAFSGEIGTLPASGGVPISPGYAASTLFGPKWLRTYNSPAMISPRYVTYILPGDEFYRGTHHIREGTFHGSFVTPVQTNHSIRLVPDGSYIPIRRSARLSLVAWQGYSPRGNQDSARLSPFVTALTRDGLELDTLPAVSHDSVGPEVTLFADGQRMRMGDTNRVPADFTLTARIADSSGILLSSLPGADAFYLYVGDYRDRVQLPDCFTYDLDSHTTGSFTYPMALPAGVAASSFESLVVVVTDNALNRTMAGVLVQTQSDSNLALSELLVYPNPVSQRAYFTFRLTRPAAVTVKLHSLSGRWLATLELPDAHAGFNTLAWDGCDNQSHWLPNGVYLYTVTARRSLAASSLAASSLGSAQDEVVTVRDKLIVRR